MKPSKQLMLAGLGFATMVVAIALHQPDLAHHAIAPHTTPELLERYVWNYDVRLAPNAIPDMSWMQFDLGHNYKLLDENGVCIGTVDDKGEIKLIHQFPDVCKLLNTPKPRTTGGLG